MKLGPGVHLVLGRALISYLVLFRWFQGLRFSGVWMPGYSRLARVSRQSNDCGNIGHDLRSQHLKKLSSLGSIFEQGVECSNIRA